MQEYSNNDQLGGGSGTVAHSFSAGKEEMSEAEDPAEGETPNKESLYCALRQFEDEKFVQDVINDIPNLARNPVQIELQLFRLKDVLDRYQEQPQLLDPYLSKWVAQLIHFVKDFSEKQTEEYRKTANLSLAVLRLMTKLRGYKVIIKFLPHHVSDVERSLGLIEDSLRAENQAHVQYKYGLEYFDDWEQQYMLLLWLSIAVQIPFDLKKLTDPADYGTERSIERRILSVCQRFIIVSEKTRDAAAYLLSRFVTRPDVLPHYGSQMIDFLLSTMKNAQEGDSIMRPHILCGCLAGIAQIFKSGTRVHLSLLAEICLPRLMELNLLTCDHSSVRKYCVKALQRLGLIFLPAKLPTWRYKRGFRSLEDNIALGGPTLGAGDFKLPAVENGVHDESLPEEIEVSELVEQVIGVMLQGLHDVDGIIRWSAAKGIGRICERLPKDFAEDVQNGVFQLFSYERSESAWHGGCLALAELSRRGALLPAHFSNVVPVVLKALFYEELRGTYAVGSSVRDAACYVCWAFARAYEPRDLQKFVDDIAKHLVLAALFDRNVNCRRAASAAFQEHVGRQGNFPRGLDIIPVLDFESLGRRTNTYLKISPMIAAHPEYTTVILDFLVAFRLNHWDASVRELAAQTLLLLTPLAPDYVAIKLVPVVLERLTSQQLFTLHGAVIGLGCICEGLHSCGYFDDALAAQVETVVLQMHPKEVYRGLGHELLRGAVMNLISRASKAQLPFHRNYPLLDHMARLVESNLTTESVKIQELAVSTLCDFLQTFGSVQSAAESGAAVSIQRKCFDELMRNLTSPSDVIRRSSVLALSIFPASFATENLSTIIGALVSVCPRSTHPDPRWIDCRRNCCRSLARLLQNLPSSAFGFDLFLSILDFLSECLSDYTEDKRGNIGRIVRLTALDTTRAIILRTARVCPHVLTPERLENIMQILLRLFCEGIPDIRASAGQAIWSISKSDSIPEFPCKSAVRKEFEKFDPKSVIWLSGACTYPIAMELLSIHEVQSAVMQGLISSLGSLTESTVRESGAAFRKYARQLSGDAVAMRSLAENLGRAMKTVMKEERLVLPALNALKQILAAGVFYGNLDQQQPQLLIDLLDAVQHIRLSQSTPKVIALIDIYAEALQFAEPTRGAALQRLMAFLSHVYPRVRVVAATKLHDGMITYDDLVAEKDTEALSLLLNQTEWAFSLEKSQEALKEIATVLHVHVKPMQLKAKVRK